MLRDSDRKPLIEYMRGLLDAAGICLPDIPFIDSHQCKFSVTCNEEHSTECIGLGSAEEFLVEAAKLLVQYVEPNVATREVKNILFGHIFFDPSTEQELRSTKGDDWRVYGSILDAIVRTGPSFYNKFVEALTHKSNGCWSPGGISGKPGAETAQFLPQNVFDNWIQENAASLKVDRSIILKVARIALTGRNEGPGLINVVRLQGESFAFCAYIGGKGPSTPFDFSAHHLFSRWNRLTNILLLAFSQVHMHYLQVTLVCRAQSAGFEEWFTDSLPKVPDILRIGKVTKSDTTPCNGPSKEAFCFVSFDQRIAAAKSFLEERMLANDISHSFVKLSTG